MNGEIYILLLHAVEELRSNILAVNPNANLERLDMDIRELYDLINGYQEPK